MKLTRSMTAKGSTSPLANCAMSDDGTTSITVIDAISMVEVGAVGINFYYRADFWSVTDHTVSLYCKMKETAEYYLATINNSVITSITTYNVKSSTTHNWELEWRYWPLAWRLLLPDKKIVGGRNVKVSYFVLFFYWSHFQESESLKLPISLWPYSKCGLEGTRGIHWHVVMRSGQECLDYGFPCNKFLRKLNDHEEQSTDGKYSSYTFWFFF